MQNVSIESVLDFWFGNVETSVAPSENRARIWFGESEQADQTIKNTFSESHAAAMSGELAAWEGGSRGQLALILMLDQFSRHLFRQTPRAFASDERALAICAYGVDNELDHELSLIERTFYYFPLMHSEDAKFQHLSMQCYQMLIDLALPETKMIYEGFYQFAIHHHSLILRFGRFPQRNEILNRSSTPDEIQYLKQLQLTRGEE